MELYLPWEQENMGLYLYRRRKRIWDSLYPRSSRRIWEYIHPRSSTGIWDYFHPGEVGEAVKQ